MNLFRLNSEEMTPDASLVLKSLACAVFNAFLHTLGI